MADLSYVLSSIAVMSLTTYLIRMLPMVLCRKKLKNPFLKSFLYYIPYAVLAAMTIPAIFTSTASLWSALGGFAVAVAVSYFGLGLMPVACSACAAAFAIEWLMKIH